MRKIKLTNKIELFHENYFMINVKAKFDDIIGRDTNNIFENKFIYNLNDIFKDKCSEHFIKNLKVEHKRFIKYLNTIWEQLAIGKPKELESIQTEISQEYMFIDNILQKRNHDIYSIEDNVFNAVSKLYSSYLLDLFQYDKFKDGDFINYLLESNKEAKNDSSEKTKYNYEGIKNMLCSFIPQEEVVIEKYFKNVSSIVKLKDALKKIEKIFPLSITIDTYPKINFCDYWNGYTLLLMSGIRVCPYCNRQYITPVITPSGKMRAEFDHYLPKNKFPYFSLSLYNLIPCCGFCNSSFKGTKEFDFNDINPYEDSFDDYAKFYADINLSKPINIQLIETDNKEKDMKKFKDMFKLDAQYSYHINQVNELIQKRIVYSEDYIHNLYKSRNQYFNSENELREIIVGYSMDKNSINNEPLAKFRRDIAEELGFFHTENAISNQKLIDYIKKYIINNK